MGRHRQLASACNWGKDMTVSQLAYVGIGVSDMARWRSFAADVLGTQVLEGGDDGTVYLRMDEYHHRIALHPSGEDDVLYIGLQASTPAAYEAGKAALRAGGISPTQGTPTEIARRRVTDLVKFETGDLPFELSVGPHMRWESPFHPARPMSGFETGALGFGHVVLRSETPKESVAMWHFMLETNAIDDVGVALDLAAKTGTPLATTLGRHSNDQMVSFYMVTPSGFEIEYGWGGRLIDDSVWQVQRADRGTLRGHKVQLEPAVQLPGVPAAR
jgi:hypothetical protein